MHSLIENYNLFFYYFHLIHIRGRKWISRKFLRICLWGVILHSVLWLTRLLVYVCALKCLHLTDGTVRHNRPEAIAGGLRRGLITHWCQWIRHKSEWLAWSGVRLQKRNVLAQQVEMIIKLWLIQNLNIC